jgi:hypothetical protein
MGKLDPRYLICANYDKISINNFVRIEQGKVVVGEINESV